MPNRLSSESSPYLLQHADNPVDWYPWGTEALASARAGDKPILLSVGYSACHWCHVMAHESFEDEVTAQLMNRLFVNIKLDREERPDIDKIYQTAHQLLTQRGGGWPLTMFLDPEDQRPFFGGTYFPNEPRYGMPAFRDLLHKVATYFSEQRDDIRAQGDRLMSVFSQLDPAPAEPGCELLNAPISRARDRFAQTFDREYGGFGPAPKFPHPTTVDRLLRHWRATVNDTEPDVEALLMATLTLRRMADGGLFDHIGGGFCRYSVDRYWQIPHFEKMLYDNGPLLAVYAQAAIATGESAFADTTNATADWMLSDMQSADGGFFAARDADSEGHEGLYYLWTPQQVKHLIGDDYEVFAGQFGLDEEANFEGRWHLTARRPLADDDRERIDRARAILLNERSQREPPARDEKQLTAWNALAIRGLAIAARALQRPDLTEAAIRAADFVCGNLFVDGRMLASYKDGEARFAAYLDDHAFLLDALLELLQSRWDARYLAVAEQLAEQLLEHFEDTQNGGFYFTADDHESLMHRPKPLADEALPSGNGIAIFALQRLGFLLGRTRYLDAAERGLRAAWRAIDEFPHGHVSLLTALEEYLDPPELVIIRGDEDDVARWRDSAAAVYAPRRMVFAIDRQAKGLPAALEDKPAAQDRTLAYRCIGTHCDLPVSSWEALAAALSESATRTSADS